MQGSIRVLLVLAAASLPLATLARGETGPTLAAPHLGVPVLAPPPPEVDGAPADTVERRWERCRRFASLVGVEQPAAFLHLDGDVSGAPAGEAGRATSFDGNGGAVSVASAPDLSGTRPYTFELWARPAAIDGRYRFLVSREAASAAGRQGTGVWISSAGLGFERWTNGAKAGITYSAGLPAGAWSHVAASYDGAVMRLYVNGRQIGSRTTAAPLAPQPGALQLGAGADGGSGFFAGALDEAAVYDRALPRSHVGAHAAAGAAPPCSAIAGATGSTYTPADSDVGDTLRVVTTARRSGSTATVTSTSESAALVDDAGRFVRPAIESPPANATVAGTLKLQAAVAGLPVDRIEFLVDGVVRYAKGEPPFEYTWRTAAEANGTHRLSVRAYGPRSDAAATAAIAVSVSNRTIYPTPLAFGRESIYAELNEGDAATAGNLLENVWPARGLPLPKLGWPLSWREDPYGDAYWRFYFYGLRPESSLLYQWETTGDTRYRDKLVAILRSFAAYDATRPLEPLTFDNNHAAAYRAMTLVNYYFKLRRAGALPADLESGLRASLARLGTFLAAPAHFEGGVNHGFNEGAALLLIADNFPELAGAASWRQTALGRLQGMLASTLDGDGVEVENSPFYHVYVLGLVYQIAEWAKRWEPALAPAYDAAARKMLRYAAYVTQPSGYLPMLGATATTFVPSQDPTVYGPMADSDPEFAFAYTRGARGTPPPDGAYLFPSSGLFLLRSPLGSPSALAQQTFVTFDAGPYRTEHSDLDALGVTMYSNGATLLPESGLYTYTAQPDRSYFHGTRAHNTVVVDGADQAAGAATPGSHGSAGGTWYARGTSALYGGVIQRRSVVLLRQGLVLVVDRMASAAAHAYAQTWHLPPGFTPQGGSQDVTVANASGQRVLAVHQAGAGGTGLEAIEGRTSPTMQGWYSSSYGSKVASYALEYTRTAPNTTFATLLAAGPYAAQQASVEKVLLAHGNRIDVCVGGTGGWSVTVPFADGPLGVSGTGCGAL